MWQVLNTTGEPSSGQKWELGVVRSGDLLKLMHYVVILNTPGWKWGSDHCVIYIMLLTHCGLVIPYGDANPGQHYFNGLSPVQCHAITWTLQCCLNIDLALRNKLLQNWNQNKYFIQEMHLKIISAKWQPYYHSLNMVTLLKDNPSVLVNMLKHLTNGSELKQHPSFVTC